jgi:hypothetical protein
MHEQMATLGRRPRIPSLFSTISINNPSQARHGGSPKRGRAYKPTRHPRQHPSCDADDKNLTFALSAASNRFGTIVEHHGVLGFGKKQPALGDEPQGRANDGETRRDHPDHAADQ